MPIFVPIVKCILGSTSELYANIRTLLQDEDRISEKWLKAQSMNSYPVLNLPYEGFECVHPRMVWIGGAMSDYRRIGVSLAVEIKRYKLKRKFGKMLRNNDQKKFARLPEFFVALFDARFHAHLLINRIKTYTFHSSINSKPTTLAKAYPS